jgi:ABC-type multidrug transport system ATPase subunit
MEIKVQQLSKRYNRDWIFKDFNFHFTKGNTYAITGPNGSGKSTLLQVLWGQIPSTKGTIVYTSEFGNIDLNTLHQHVAIATPYMDLPEALTLEEAVKFHYSFKQIRSNYSIGDLLEVMQLSHAKGKFIHQFSSGMKQRLKLGLCILSQADFVFLDEPGTNLDNSALKWFHNLLIEIQNEAVFIIASNLSSDFPVISQEINLLSLKSIDNNYP